MNDRHISDIFYLLKGVAIISVVCAHCNIQINGGVTYYLRAILNNLGTVGVGIFFFTSGYYFKYKKLDIKKFVTNKIVSYVVPWLVAATSVWIYIVVRKGGMSIDGWANYVIGNGSIYYFMFDLLFIQCLFYAVCNNVRDIKCFCIGAAIINVIAILLEASHISLAPTPYMNPFIFIGYFSLGVICKERILIPELLKCRRKSLVILSSLISILILLQPFYSLSYYKDVFTFPIELVFIVTLMLIFDDFYNEVLYKMGNNSFFIYLWHLPLAGIVSNLASRSLILAHTALLWPFIILFAMSLLANIVSVKQQVKVREILGLK